MPGSPQDNQKLAIEIAVTLLAGLYVFLLVFKFPATPLLMEGDHLIFLYDAGRMMQGEILYKDFFQFTFPGGQALYYLLFQIFGQQYWILPAVICGIAVGSTWLILRISDRLIDGYLYLLPALVFIFFGFRFFGLDGSHRMLSPLAVLAGLYFIARGTTAANLIAAGICCAVASFFTQQRGFISVLAVGIFILVEAFANRESKLVILKRAALLGVSCVIGLAAMLGYFIAAAGLENFYRSTIEYPSLYYRFHEQNSYVVLFTDLQKAFAAEGFGQSIAILPNLFYSFIVPLVPVAFFTYFIARRRAHEWSYWRGALLMAVASVFLLLGTTAPSPFRLFQISTPAIILFFWLVSEILKKYRLQEFWLAAGISTILLLFGAAQTIRMQTNWDHVYIDLPAGRVAAVRGPVADRYAWLAQNTTAGDYFYEVAEPFIYFPLQLRNASGVNAIFMSGVTRTEHIDNVLSGLERNKPRLILWENQYNKPLESRASGDVTAPLSAYVLTHYQPIGEPYTVNGRETQIWQRK